MAGNASRWQPTVEQVEILESVYSVGVNTPTPEQIQQITSRLIVYGHIECKNVFYWFQNTKARRRYKQKQDRLALLTTLYHQSPPPLGEARTQIQEPKATLELFPLQPGGVGDSSGTNSNTCDL